MLRNMGFLALALALVSAVEDNAFSEALDTIKLMKSQGLGANECQALADSSLTAVSGAKDTSQKLLGSLSTGSECAQSGQTEVAAATKSLDDATDAASNAKSALDKANAIVPAVEIPSMAALKGMGESCGFFYNSDAFKNGNAAVITALATKTEADARVVSSKSALQAAKDAATKKAKECRCGAKTTLEREWAIASNPTTAAAQKSEWDKAQSILCALSAKSPCNAPAVPTVVKPTLSVDTMAQVCDAVVIGADCAASLDGGGWSLVRHTNKATWHKATDQLTGKDAYGSDIGNPLSDTQWSVKFDDRAFNQFLFATGDCQRWLIANKADVYGNYANEPRTIQKSWSKNTPYMARWYRRSGNLEDPWISSIDHNDAIGAGEILYGENNIEMDHARKVLPLHNGANVYIRTSP